MLTRKLDTVPDLLALHAADRARFPYLLRTGGAGRGRDLLLALPREVRRYRDGDAARCRQDLAALDTGPVGEDGGLPFIGGWFVFLGYEMLSAFEDKVPPSLPDDFPLAVIARVPAAVMVDRAAGEAIALAETPSEFEVLLAALATVPPPVSGRPQLLGLEEEEPARYTDAIARLKHYIAAGDVFQVNISRGWRARLAPGDDAAGLFAALDAANPAPFSALADFGDAQVISASPERLVEVRDRRVLTRPIAGTHPRSADPDQDRRLRERLIASAKERAEHVMLIDLERNDLGRICQPGSVMVEDLMALTSYAFVHHIESSVCGRLRPEIRPVDVLRALFPGGTITGCPKVRTMQIIRELEPTPRRAYTGSLGYINRDGSMDFNILIRSFMKQGDCLRFRAGGGIVADSDAARELQETRHKARGLLRALGVNDR